MYGVFTSIILLCINRPHQIYSKLVLKVYAMRYLNVVTHFTAIKINV